ncbi:MAG TPA: carboxypeptidase regulatory-like domain-containing protein [Candidatus Saccharimonadales bacterium]|nr:carboxypeptidase regulatory-like domain-containing protein [Candidatus Saccharimonadales bacterium]
MNKYFLLIFVFLLAVSLPANGQSNYAAIVGTVTDAQHLPVAGASVQLTAVSTGSARRVVTNGQGLFEFPALLPDEYQLKTEASGFAVATQTVRLEVGQKLSLEIPIKLGSVTQGVSVTSASEVLHTADASVGEVVEPKSIRELPLNGRMLIDLVLTVPGAHVGFGAQTGTTNPLYWRPGQRSAVVIGGGRANANFFLLDGATNTDPTFNTQNLSPSPDAVREFQVETSSYTADMGGAGGGQINIVTHSGSSQFHGTVYEFLRNGALDASTFASMGNNHLVQNNFGASFGGPLIGRNTFFFVNYEGLRLSQADAQILTVPTMAELQGDFSMSSAAIYDPTTAVPNPGYNSSLPTGPSNFPYTRSQFPGNVIPTDRINPLLEAFLMQYVPQPSMDMGNMGGGMAGGPSAAGVDSNNYLDVRNENHFQNQASVRIDHNFAGGDTLFGRYSISTENGFSPSSGMTSTTENLPGFGANFDNRSQQAVISWNHIFSPNKVNTASVAVSRLSMDRTSQNDNVNDIVGQLGIQGVGFGGPGAWGSPWFAVQGYTGIGDTFAATPMHAWDTMYEIRDTYSWQRGRHGVKLGGDFHWYTWPMWGFFQNRGFYQFTNGYTTESGFNDGSGSGLASFLLSLPAVKQRQAGIPQMNLRNWGGDAFIEDSWQIRSTLTVNYGVRYEYSSPLYDKNNTNTNLIFQDGVPSVFVGGEQGYPKGLMYANKHNFAPRFGLAKSLPNWGLVFHASYGIFFTPVDQNTWCNQRHNVPYVFPETQQADNFTPPAALFATGLNFGKPVLGTGTLPATTVSFTAFDPHSPAQYVQQWSASVQKGLGKDSSVEIGYLGSRGFHLQRAHLINNTLPGPGPLGPRRPFKTLTFIPDTTLPTSSTDAVIQSTTFPVSTINLLENSAQSWYDAGYVNIRRRYSHGLSFLANYTYSKSLTNAPDFRSPMDEASIPQDNNNLNLEKGPGCDVRHRLALSAVYDLPAYARAEWLKLVTQNWHFSTIYQIQSGMPFTISVFGDTANSGTVLGENPIRANVTGQPIFGPGTHTADMWFNPDAFAAPPAFTYGNAGRNSIYGPGLQTMDIALARSFAIKEKMNFQFRAEAFNAFNKVNLGTPNRFVNEPQFGTTTMAMTPGRQIQLSARLSF